MSKVGGHVSAAISLDLTFDRAQEIGAECFQFFVSPPQQWVQSKHQPEELENFKRKAHQTGIGPNFIHSTYLVNLGTQDPAHLKRSIDWLVYALSMAESLGVEGVIVHTGSHKGVGFEKVLPQITKAIVEILAKSSEAALILENAAGAGDVIGDKFSELGAIIKSVGNGRVKICLDTCHAFASGYDIKSPIGLKDALTEFDEEIGIKRLVAIHANDSKFEIGQNKDRHANIGEGFLGRDGFENLINNPALKEVPFILEVPGFADNGPDAENVEILKSLRK